MVLCLGLCFAAHPAMAEIWLSAAEVQARPMSGAAWYNLLSTADEPVGHPNLSDQDDETDLRVLAKALVHARTGITSYRTEVVAALRSIVTESSEDGTPENPGRVLALGRNLAPYVISADVIDLPDLDPVLDAAFRSRLGELLTKDLDGRTLQSTHEDRPNNWGTMAGASRAAVAAYLGDTNELARTAQVFRGYLGDRAAYAGFSYDSDLSWHCNPAAPVGINPLGCMIEGIDVGGALPDEMRRGDSFRWPPRRTNYPWEGLQGALVQAEILHRAGYDAWNWSDRALLRAALFLYGIGWPAKGDDEWQVWLLNHVYGTSFPVETSGARFGKIMGWTDWTHGTAPPRQAGSPMAYLRATVSAGLGTVHPPVVVAATGTTIRVTATPAAYYFFHGWSGDLASSEPEVDVVLLGPTEIKATFEALTVTHGVPEWWLAEYGLATTDAAALEDPDGDGARTWEEYLAGTVPTNAGSVLTLTAQMESGGSFRLSWPSRSGRRYALQAGTPFVDAEVDIEPTPPTNSWVQSMGGDCVFYRIMIQP